MYLRDEPKELENKYVNKLKKTKIKLKPNWLNKKIN